MRAIFRLALIRVLLRVSPFDRIRGFIDRRAIASQPADRRAMALMIRRAMERATRTLPASSCLARSLTAELLLRERGVPVRLSIGVADRKPGAPLALDAHAWAVSEGLVIAGDGELERYTALLSFGSPM